jgi:arginase
MAIGTWSGVVDAYDAYEKMGLIWVDAHLDAHTPETSESGNIHGMPLAVLLGQGFDELTAIQKPMTKLHPEHVVVIGVRSYEAGERAFLESLGVRIYYMDEVRARGFENVFNEAVSIVSKAPKGFGISLDIDVFDPVLAPGTGTKTRNGLYEEDVEASFRSLLYMKGLLAFEFAEFNPSLDKEDKTIHLIKRLVSLISTPAN